MDDVRRVTPEEAHQRVESGQALLVCAYEDEARCRQLHIGDALTMEELRRLLERDQKARDRELIFYCA
jgi:hypothetical protein